jgi:trk system potassium uptake protein TrkH
MRLSLQNRINQYTRYASQVLGVIAFTTLFMKYGFHLSERLMTDLIIIDEFIAGFFVLILLTNFFVSDQKWKFIKESPFEMILMILFIVSIILEEIISIEEPHYLLKRATTHNFIKLYFIIIQIYIVINGIIALTRAREKWLYFSLSPARIIVISYFLMIVTGTLILKLPKATYQGISWVDAFFTSTSAVCITGLSTLNISRVFTFEGQVFIMILIQIGGLGIITLTSFIALFIQRGLRLRDQLIVQELFDSENFNSLASILKAIIAITFSMELVGAVALFVTWNDLGLSEFERIFSAVFHSVSAFCNAGFSIFPNGLETSGMQFSSISLMVLMALIVAGGIGFYTFSDLLHIGDLKQTGKRRLSLQSRIILVTSLGLILFGAILIWVIEKPYWHNLSIGKQVINSFFLSVTSRTAGFSNVSIAGMAVPALMVIVFLMYIGGAPNSSSGGIKITTFVTVIASIRSYITGRDKVEIGWNHISARTVKRALIVILVSFILIFVSLLILTLTEEQDFFDLFFETISAFGTVGLSRGVTPLLSNAGKIIIALVMFAGRIGLFTFAIAVVEEREQDAYSFPEIDLMVG